MTTYVIQRDPEIFSNPAAKRYYSVLQCDYDVKMERQVVSEYARNLTRAQAYAIISDLKGCNKRARLNTHRGR